MKDKILQLISFGETQKALELLASAQPKDAVLLQSQFANGQKQYNIGILDYSEWQKVQTKINMRLLQLLDSPADEVPSDSPAQNGRRVFISYNWDDQETALAVKEALEAAQCVVTIDTENVQAGESIQSFIENSIKNNHFIVSIVSKNSLASGWVGRESTMALFAQILTDARFIPVALDHAFNDDEFYLETLESINQNIIKYQELAAKATQLGAGGRTMQDKLNRFTDLRANFDNIIQQIRSVNTVSIAGDAFSKGMSRVIARVQAG